MTLPVFAEASQYNIYLERQTTIILRSIFLKICKTELCSLILRIQYIFVQTVKEFYFTPPVELFFQFKFDKYYFIFFLNSATLQGKNLPK